MLVRRLSEDDLEPLWQMRLQALTNNPEAFGSTYEEVVARGSGWLLERLQQNWQETFYLGAFDDSLIGMVGFFRESGTKERRDISPRLERRGLLLLTGERFLLQWRLPDELSRARV